MPNKVIAKVHHLSIAPEKYDSIVFANADRNMLSEQITEKTDE